MRERETERQRWGEGSACRRHSEHRFPAPSSKTLAELVAPLKGHSLSPRSCPKGSGTNQIPNTGLRQRKVPESGAWSVGTNMTAEAT